MSTFDVSHWLAQHPAATCDSIHVSQPALLGCWTKHSAHEPPPPPPAAGGDDGHEEKEMKRVSLRFRCGDTSGASSAASEPLLAMHMRCTGPDITLPPLPTAGLLPYAPARLPVPLEGPYLPKEAEEDVGVETVVRAAAAAGAPLAACDVLSFRNNLNK